MRTTSLRSVTRCLVGVVGLLAFPPPSSSGQIHEASRAVETSRLGAVDGEESIWYVQDLAVDGERVYVGDARAAKVLVFDRGGNFERFIGRPGQGPGEFGSIHFLQVLGRELVVTDLALRRLSFFSPEGELSRTQSIVGLPSPPIQPPVSWVITEMGANGLRVLTGRVGISQLDDHPITPIVLVDAEGNLVDSLPSFVAGGRYAIVRRSNGGSTSFGLPFHDGSFHGVSQNGRFFGHVLPDSGGLRLTVVDIEAGARRTEWVDFPGVTVSREYADSLRTSMFEGFSRLGASEQAFTRGFRLPARATIDEFAIMDDGLLWVREVEFTGDARTWWVYDVLGEKSPYPVEVPAGVKILERVGDELWGMTRDDWGVQYVVKLRLLHLYGGA